jgi:O-methyltransferase
MDKQRAVISLQIFLKNVLLGIRPHILFSWLRNPFQTFANTIALSKWISEQNKNTSLNDFFTFKRNYVKREQLHILVVGTYNLTNENAICYLEFGVSAGTSFKWWLAQAKHEASTFYGFDTFEGLPEKWGVYDSGAMAAVIPNVNDTRAKFYKGLFQDTLPLFLKNITFIEGQRKVIHLDADLFSSTLYALTSLAPYLRKGDILMFDEFNVPNHEFLAFKMFVDSFYVQTKLIGAVNNYYQIALEIV